MSAPFFSIVTVVWNGEAEVGPTAASLMDQTLGGGRDFEWVVVDGASADGTLDVVCRFLDPERDILLSEPDRGVYDAMNKGLGLARGEVVQFLNAGDTLAGPDVLARVRAAFGEGAGADIVYGDAWLTLANGRRVLRPARTLETAVRRRMPCSHQSFFARTALHRAHPFDLSLKIAADYGAIASMVAAMTGAGARARRLEGPPLSVNTIEPGAISVKGRVRSAAEDYRVQREVLGLSAAEAWANFLRKRAVILGSGALGRLPPGVLARLPKGLGDRVY